MRRVVVIRDTLRVTSETFACVRRAIRGLRPHARAVLRDPPAGAGL